MHSTAVISLECTIDIRGVVKISSFTAGLICHQKGGGVQNENILKYRIMHKLKSNKRRNEYSLLLRIFIGYSTPRHKYRKGEVGQGVRWDWA